jgi:hypothetical protein
MINLPFFFILQGFSALFGCGFFYAEIPLKISKN